MLNRQGSVYAVNGKNGMKGIVFERLAKDRMMIRCVEREFKMSTACDHLP